MSQRPMPAPSSSFSAVTCTPVAAARGRWARAGGLGARFSGVVQERGGGLTSRLAALSASVRAMINVGTPITSAARRAATSF